jgi:NTP pyrophosphatase (non-canonical NTP hydrolase)
MINKLSKEIHEINVKNGFYEAEKNIGEMIALIHSEASEALEADRKSIRFPKNGSEDNLKAILGWVSDEDFKSHFQKQVKDTFEDEIADTMIRLMDLSAYLGIDLEGHIKAKMRYNSLREYKHGKKY